MPKYSHHVGAGFYTADFLFPAFAVWFTDLRLRLKCTGFFKTVFYLPNVIMAASFAMLFLLYFLKTDPLTISWLHSG